MKTSAVYRHTLAVNTDDSSSIWTETVKQGGLSGRKYSPQSYSAVCIDNEHTLTAAQTSSKRFQTQKSSLVRRAEC